MAFDQKRERIIEGAGIATLILGVALIVSVLFFRLGDVMKAGQWMPLDT